MNKNIKEILVAFVTIMLTVGTFSFTYASVTPTDTTPPVITAPIDQSFATSTFPAMPTLVPATATDDSGLTPTITYSPTTFPVGASVVTWTATDASGNTSTATSNVTITDDTPPADTATITIRDGVTALGPWTVTLPSVSASPSQVTPNEGTTTAVSLNGRSLLAALESLTASHSEFTIPDVEYFDFGQPYSSGLYLNCVSIPSATSTPLCGSWQYQVNGTSPQSGAGAFTLNNNDNVFLYFGTPRDVSLSTNTVIAGQAFTATAQSYNPSDNTFSPATGVTIGVTQPNPNNPWSPLEISTSTVDSSGQAIFTLNATGTYSVGIKEDYYSPATALTVIDTPSTPTDGGSGGEGGSPTKPTFNIPLALSYLSSKQNADGSYDSPDLSDWTAIAFAAADPGTAKTKLHTYLLSATPSMSNITDYERHAMALEALNINPYSGTPVNYIAPIVNSFGGTWSCNSSLDNANIFAVIPLMQAGYAPTDPLIQKIIACIMSQQNQDSKSPLFGSWDGSPDMTAAAIQAVGPFFMLPTYPQVMGGAAAYLKTTEQPNGSWGTGGVTNIDSTSWVQTAINAIPTDPAHGGMSWVSSIGYLPTDAIASAQQGDGAVRPASDTTDNRVWSTSYAVVASSVGQSWLSVLQLFSIPPDLIGGTGTGMAVANATSTSTTTSPTATTTPPVIPMATTTVPIIATTTTEFIPDVVGTTTATTTLPVVRHIKKPVRHTSNTIPVAPHATTSSQTAAAASAPNSNLFGAFWHFVANLFHF